MRTHGKRRNEKGMEQAAPRHATTPVNAGSDPTPPNDALWGESRHDHPDAPARRRGHPWPLEHASAVPTIAGHGAQRAVHNPAAEAHATSTLRSDDQKPCSGRNLDRESPPIIHGAPKNDTDRYELERSIQSSRRGGRKKSTGSKPIAENGLPDCVLPMKAPVPDEPNFRSQPTGPFKQHFHAARRGRVISLWPQFPLKSGSAPRPWLGWCALPRSRGR